MNKTNGNVILLKGKTPIVGELVNFENEVQAPSVRIGTFAYPLDVDTFTEKKGERTFKGGRILTEIDNFTYYIGHKILSERKKSKKNYLFAIPT